MFECTMLPRENFVQIEHSYFKELKYKIIIQKNMLK